MAFFIIVSLLVLLALAFVIVPVMKKESVLRAPSLRLILLALGLGALVALPSVGLYAYLGRPDLAGVSRNVTGQVEAPAAAQDAGQGAAAARADVEKMVADLKAKAARAPNNPGAWQNLGWAYMHVSRPADAAIAYKRAVSLAPGNGEYLSALTEAIVQSGDGKITQAEAADFRRVVSLTPVDARARFYLALYKDQRGDHKGAIADWIGMLKSAPPDSAWAGEVRTVVEQVAREQGVDISAQLPPAPTPPASVDASLPAQGPDAAQIAAAQQMSPTDRTAMIHGMVDGLAARLKQNPQDADGWLRLIRARMVLGEKAQAATDYRDARKAFFSAPADLAALDNAAHAMGVSGP